MDRIKKLGKYQKIVLLALAVIVVVFTVVYAVEISRVGYLYNGIIFVPKKNNGKVVYSASYRGSECSFIVSEDNTVVFETATSEYGPYYFKEDPSAIPTGSGVAELMKGLEVKYEDKVIFRGGIVKTNDGNYWVYNEDGTLAISSSAFNENEESIVDGHGQTIDKNTLFVCGITDLMLGPELTHKGSWLAWLGCVIFCVIIAISIIFSDELFRLSMSFRIRNYEKAEPSDWEIVGRYLAWTIFPFMAIWLFKMGLKP